LVPRDWGRWEGMERGGSSREGREKGGREGGEGALGVETTILYSPEGTDDAARSARVRIPVVAG